MRKVEGQDLKKVVDLLLAIFFNSLQKRSFVFQKRTITLK